MEEYEHRISSCEKRISVLEAGQNNINIELAKISILIENVQKSVDELKTDVNELKAKPSKKWDLIVTGIISATVTGIVTLAISTLLK